MTQQKYQQDAACNRIYYSKVIDGSTCLEQHTAHHQESQTAFAASGLYTHVVTGLDNGQSPYGYINQRLQMQFGASDGGRFTARDMLSLQ